MLWRGGEIQVLWGAVVQWWSSRLVPSPARLRGEWVSSPLKKVSREGEAPADPRQTSDISYEERLGRNSPSLLQWAVRTVVVRRLIAF